MYAIVQHSAAGYKGDNSFAHGLEVRRVTAKQRDRVQQLGGEFFATFGEADAYADTESYPKGYEGLVPNAPGAFVNETIDGLKIYIPRRY